MKENWEINWKDYYQILQVHPSAEPEIITAAYKKLLDKYHPDHNPGNEQWATEKSKEINNAYDVLEDPLKRREYDKERLRRNLKNDSSEAQDESIHFDDGKKSSPSSQPETTSKATPDVTTPGTITETQASNSTSGTKTRKVKSLPVFAGILAIVIIILGIVFLHFNKASNTNQSQTYTVGLPAITLTYPNGGETWHVGDVVTIKWTSTNISEHTAVNVSVSLASTQPYTPAVIIKIGSTTNKGSFTWTVTGDQFITTNGTGDYAKVLVEAMGTSAISATGFTIAQ